MLICLQENKINMKINKLHEISRENRVPFYLQAKEQLLSVIITDIEVGDKLDNEMDLCSIFGVSRPTIRQAIKELENEGFITRVKGFGTFVKSRKIETSLMQDVAFFTEELEAKHINFLNRILVKNRIVPKKEVAHILGLKKDDEVNYIERLRLVMNQPLYFTIIHIPEKICKGFIENDLINNSTTALIQDKYGIHISGIKRYLNPVNKNLFSKAAEVLMIDRHECFFYMRSILFDKKDNPVGFYEDFFSSEKSEFTFYTKR